MTFSGGEWVEAFSCDVRRHGFILPEVKMALRCGLPWTCGGPDETVSAIDLGANI